MSDRPACPHCGENRSDTEHPAYTFYNCGFNGVERSWQCRARAAEQQIARLSAQLQAANNLFELAKAANSVECGITRNWKARAEAAENKLAAIDSLCRNRIQPIVSSEKILDILHPTPPAPPAGCPLDTDGDGNCWKHPQGCPTPVNPPSPGSSSAPRTETEPSSRRSECR